MTLLSDASKNEFKDNTPYDFKTRLAHPIEFDGEQWEVGLVSLSISKTLSVIKAGFQHIDDVKMTEPENADYIFKTKFNLYTLEGALSKQQTLSFGKNDIKELNIKDGVKLMKEMIHHFKNKVMTEVKVVTTTDLP